MRSLRWLPFLLLLVAVPVAAAQPRCPLDLATCLRAFDRMHHRPWLGISVDRDSLGRVIVAGVEEGAPAQSAGLRAGDVIETIDGQPPATWFAGKAGWKTGDLGAVAVLRGTAEKAFEVRYQPIPEDVFARIVGVHMVEAHLAYLDAPPEPKSH